MTQIDPLLFGRCALPTFCMFSGRAIVPPRPGCPNTPTMWRAITKPYATIDFDFESASVCLGHAYHDAPYRAGIEKDRIAIAWT